MVLNQRAVCVSQPSEGNFRVGYSYRYESRAGMIVVTDENGNQYFFSESEFMWHFM